MSTETIIGGYRLLNLLYQGQSSQVWECGELSSGRHFALKVLLPEAIREEEPRRLLVHEANVGKQLQHKNVIRIVKLLRHREVPYLVTEFFASQNLKLRIKNRHELVPKHAHYIIEQAAAGFAHVNSKGWVHRDIKPENILVNSTADVRVIDFALAQRISKGGFFKRLFAKKGIAQGTMSYMSPEQVRNEPLDERADIYSFGATIYELVANRPPFIGVTKSDLLGKHLHEDAATPQTYNPQVSNDCAALILRMLSKKPKDRPGDFNEFMATFYNTRVFKGDKLDRRPK